MAGTAAVAAAAPARVAGVAIGHRRQHFHGTVPLLDGDAEPDAVDQAVEPFRVVALGRADQALGDNAAVIVGQRQHDAAVEALDAQVDPVLRGEGGADLIKGIVHGRGLQ